MAVGSLDSRGHRSDFSSQGPCLDGRTKPDLAVYGETTRGSGSSPATAFASGCAVKMLRMKRARGEPGSDKPSFYAFMRDCCTRAEPADPNATGAGIPNLLLAAEKLGFADSIVEEPVPTRGKRLAV